ncbi:MAG: hypothetical protein KI792_12495 [Alphaproteobacteria bacterium]|nr:hypothetical protein [Alphaproteobacteria bacterium SS10]
MKLRDFIQQPPFPDEERIYTLQNKYFYLRAGIDLAQHKQVPTGQQMLFVGSADVSLDALVQNNVRGLAPAFQAVGQAQGIYSIIMGKSDFEIDDAFMAMLPPNVVLIAGCSVNTTDPRALYLPMGCDFRSRTEAQSIKPRTPEERDILCYANFSVNTHPSRPPLAERLVEAPDILCEHMGAFMKYSLSRADFFDRLSRSKFAISPRGNGIESFRMWDCLYLGVIPVVKREAVFMGELEDLPVLLIDDWDEFLGQSPDDWHALYDQFLDRQFNWEKLKLSFWMKRIYDQQFDRFTEFAKTMNMESPSHAQ